MLVVEGEGLSHEDEMAICQAVPGLLSAARELRAAVVEAENALAIV
jgi:hypothetical protein